MGQGLRFVLVDDSEEDRFLVMRELAREFPGAALERVATAAQFNALLAEDNFDLLITDYQLGWTDGIALLDALRSRYPDVPVIMFTGTGSEEVAVQAMKAGLDDYLLKSPRHLGRLSSAVRAALDRAEVRRRAARLEAERNRLSDELRRRADELAGEARKKDEFLAILGHELRNPLAPLRNALRILRQPGVADDDAEWAKGMMERQLAIMTRLIDDLLDVSRIARGKIDLTVQPLDLAAVVRDTVEAARHAAEARDHALVLDAPHPVRVRADRTRLEQVFGNLLDNAVRYTEPGGRIDVVVTHEGAEAVVRIRDNGSGIDGNLLEWVFEPFTRGERSPGGRSQWGLGVGLALVRSLVGLHGGSVRASSDGPGRGSEFVVRLPAIGADAPSAGAAGPSGGKPAVKRLRILVVDDNRDAADSLARLLRLDRHETRAVYEGPEALDAAPEFKPDVVLLDIGMPGMDGYEVARRFRRIPALARTMLVALTGWGQPEDRQRAVDAGFDHHLVKPADPDVLAAILTAANPAAP